MHIVICMDDRNGILFNGRRLSSDIAVCQRLIGNHSGRLMMNHYSAKLFDIADVYVDEIFLQKAHAEDTCFVEDLEFTEYLPHVSSVTVYRWNRHYPSDIKLPEQFLENWKMVQRTDFAGNSHENITEERYIP